MTSFPLTHFCPNKTLNINSPYRLPYIFFKAGLENLVVHQDNVPLFGAWSEDPSSCRKKMNLGADYMAKFGPEVRRAEILLGLHDKFQLGLEYKPGRQIWNCARRVTEKSKWRQGHKLNRCNTVLRNLAWLSIFNFLGCWQPTKWWKRSKTCLVMVWWQETQRKSIRLHISESWLP